MRVMIIALLAAISYAQTVIDCEQFTLQVDCVNNQCSWDGEECELAPVLSKARQVGGGEGGAGGAPPVDCESFILQQACVDAGCGWDGEECDIYSEVHPAGGELPEGHPMEGGEFPEGHPMEGGEFPEGHPMSGEVGEFPEGHPMSGEVGEGPFGGERPEAGEVPAGIGGGGAFPGYNPVVSAGEQGAIFTFPGSNVPQVEFPATIFDNVPQGGTGFGPPTSYGPGTPGHFNIPAVPSELPFGPSGIGGEPGEAPEGGEGAAPGEPIDCEMPTTEASCVAADCCWDGVECDDPGEVPGCTAGGMGAGGEGGEAPEGGAPESPVEPAEPAEPAEVEADCRLGFTYRACMNIEGCVFFESNCYPVLGGALAGTNNIHCDATKTCSQRTLCLGKYRFPTSCGPSNCDRPIGECESEIEHGGALRNIAPQQGSGITSQPWKIRWFLVGAGCTILLGFLVSGYQHFKRRSRHLSSVDLDSRLMV